MIKLHRTRIGFSGLFSSSGSALTKTRRRKLKNQHIVFISKLHIQHIEKKRKNLGIFLHF